MPSAGELGLPASVCESDEPLPEGEHSLQLYSFGTPNSAKVLILLEELGLDYDPWLLDMPVFTERSGHVHVHGDTIPCMRDRDTDRTFLGSKAILVYLGKKFQLLPPPGPGRDNLMRWLDWCPGSVTESTDPVAPIRDSWQLSPKLAVLDVQLAGREYINGGYEPTLADFSVFPWIHLMMGDDRVVMGLDIRKYAHVCMWAERMLRRTAVKRACERLDIGYPLLPPEQVLPPPIPETFSPAYGVPFVPSEHSELVPPPPAMPWKPFPLL